VAGSCKHGNEHSDSIKGGECLKLSDYLLLKKDSAPLESHVHRKHESVKQLTVRSKF
jgi:hypothetical protein